MNDHRYDCFLVWGHGAPYIECILELISSYKDIDIVHIEKYNITNMNKFIKSIYSFDYAPLLHLKSKVRYLKSTPYEVFFVFVKNTSSSDDYFGEGKFRHKESTLIKKIKERIRDLYNPYDNTGNRTHDHVVHATDNEAQADSMIKILGYRDGISKFYSKSTVLNIPNYIYESSKLTIREVNYNKIYCANAIETDGLLDLKLLPVDESIQYQGLSDISVYADYIEKFRGTILKRYYVPKKFLNLASGFSYLSEPHESDFVVVNYDRDSQIFVIADGLHRAAIHRHQGFNKIKVCVIHG